MSDMNEIQWQILDSVYFVESFEHILEEVEGQKAVVADELKILIDRGWIQVMEFNEKGGDYQKTIFYDSDDMHAYQYLATKQGLMKHNGK